MKKLLLGLGAATSVIAPIAAVVACGDAKNENETLKGPITGDITSGIGAVMLPLNTGTTLSKNLATQALDFIKTKYDALSPKADLTSLVITTGVSLTALKTFAIDVATINAFVKAIGGNVATTKTAAISAIIAVTGVNSVNAPVTSGSVGTSTIDQAFAKLTTQYVGTLSTGDTIALHMTTTMGQHSIDATNTFKLLASGEFQITSVPSASHGSTPNAKSIGEVISAINMAAPHVKEATITGASIVFTKVSGTAPLTITIK